MNEIETYLVYIINHLDTAGIIRKEAICEACIGNSSSDRAYLSTIELKKTVVNKLNGVNAISNANLGQWCRNRGIHINSFNTLETCLRRGKFSYKQRRGNRIYYIKNGVDCPQITTEDIIL